MTVSAKEPIDAPTIHHTSACPTPPSASQWISRGGTRSGDFAWACVRLSVVHCGSTGGESRVGDGPASRATCSCRRRPTSCCCLRGLSAATIRRSLLAWSVTAASTVLRPAVVSDTRTCRPSSGLFVLTTSPRCSSRSSRFVIAPEVTIIDSRSWPGVSWCGSPHRNSVARTSNSHDSSPWSAKTSSRSGRMHLSRRDSRPMIAMPEVSRSGRCAFHCFTISSTRSDCIPQPYQFS